MTSVLSWNEDGGWFTTEFADEMDGPARCVVVQGIVDSVIHLNDDFVQMRVTINCGRSALVGLSRDVWDKDWKDAIRLGQVRNPIGLFSYQIKFLLFQTSS